MSRLGFSIDLAYEIAGPPADFVFNVHAAQTQRQAVLAERVTVDPPQEHRLETDAATGNRLMRLHAGPGPVSVRYEATVELDTTGDSSSRPAEVPINGLAAEVLPFVYPSRYCPSDRLHGIAAREFGNHRPGYGRVMAIRDWVRGRTALKPGAMNGGACALDTLTGREGIGRDFAHLMIALCRALHIPARIVTGIGFGARATRGTPQLQAIVEVFLGERWYPFDPSGIAPPTGLVRIGMGRDAADVPVVALFGADPPRIPVLSISALEIDAGAAETPEPHEIAIASSPIPRRPVRQAPAALHAHAGVASPVAAGDSA